MVQKAISCALSLFSDGHLTTWLIKCINEALKCCKHNVGIKISLIHCMHLKATHLKVSGLLDGHMKRFVILRFFSLFAFRVHLPLVHLLIPAGFTVLRQGKNTISYTLAQYGRLGKKKTGNRRTTHNPKITINFTYIAHFSSDFSIL